MSRSDLSPADLDARLGALTAEFKAVVDADLKRQHERVEDREVEEDDDRD